MLRADWPRNLDLIGRRTVCRPLISITCRIKKAWVSAFTVPYVFSALCVAKHKDSLPSVFVYFVCVSVKTVLVNQTVGSNDSME
jgi:hypothetical protein